MQPLVIVVGGKNANIRKQDGQSIRATMSRFVDRVIVGGNVREKRMCISVYEVLQNNR